MLYISSATPVISEKGRENDTCNFRERKGKSRLDFYEFATQNSKEMGNISQNSGNFSSNFFMTCEHLRIPYI